VICFGSSQEEKQIQTLKKTIVDGGYRGELIDNNFEEEK
jgi:hypothetical protein